MRPHSLFLSLAALATLPAAASAQAPADALAPPSDTRDASVDSTVYDAGPEAALRDAGPPGDEPPPVPDGRRETMRACAAVSPEGAPPNLERPWRVAFPALVAPWARSVSEIFVTASPGSDTDLPSLRMRLAGEAYVPFDSFAFFDVVCDFECPEDTACDCLDSALNGHLPAQTRFPAPFELEVARADGEWPAIDEICVVFTAYEADEPGPIDWSDPNTDVADPLTADAGGYRPPPAEMPSDEAPELPVGGEPVPADGESSADGADEAACSTTPGRPASPAALAVLCLAAAGLRRRLRRSPS
jgi:MYXO-CTERM domain-containing protein